jgi:integrase
VAARLSEIAAHSGAITANRARAALSAVFAWAMREGLAESNAVIGTNRAVDEKSRSRVLTGEELAAIWRACRGDDYGRIVRLLILTGQRREEVGGMAGDEIDWLRARWTIPGERTKNGRPHDVPLSAPAVEILKAVPYHVSCERFFGEGHGPFQGWSKAKASLDRRIAQGGSKLAPWRLHDIRRTVATRMAELGTLPHVIEAVLNHVSGHKAGVAGIYNRANYTHERCLALERWGEQVIELERGGSSHAPLLTWPVRLPLSEGKADIRRTGP